jgi:hypothetical protein
MQMQVVLLWILRTTMTTVDIADLAFDVCVLGVNFQECCSPGNTVMMMQQRRVCGCCYYHGDVVVVVEDAVACGGAIHNNLASAHSIAFARCHVVAAARIVKTKRLLSVPHSHSWDSPRCLKHCHDNLKNCLGDDVVFGVYS